MDENRWVPVQEKLPPDRHIVIVTTQNCIGERYVHGDFRYTHDLTYYIESVKMENPNGIWEYLTDALDDYWDIFDTGTVIAWREYPEPYMGNG